MGDPEHWEAGQKVRVTGLPARKVDGFHHTAGPDWDGTICKTQDERTDGLVCVVDRNQTHRPVATGRVTHR